MESIDLTDFLEAEERDLTLLRLTSFLSLWKQTRGQWSWMLGRVGWHRGCAFGCLRQG